MLLLSPDQPGGKHEPTKWSKVEAPDGKLLEDQRWRTLKVQSFEDGLFARVLTRAQCNAEKEDLAAPYQMHNAPVLAGVGHVGAGEELFWRHVGACASKTSSVFYNSTALGDDFSCGEAGQLYSSDFTAFDETASLARFLLTGLTFVHGGSQAKVNEIINGALVGYHEALAHQPSAHRIARV